MHWRIDAKLLQPLIPEPLQIDEFDGSAWIAIAPFTMWDIRAFPPFIPPPGLNSAHELNRPHLCSLRSRPGCWFFSLDCNSAAAVLEARTFFHLPYFNADIDLKEYDTKIDYALSRTDDPPADFDASWKIETRFPSPIPARSSSFLPNVIASTAQTKVNSYRARIHQPWPLQKAELLSFTSTMIESQGLPTPQGKPLLHYREELSVEV